MAFHVDATQNNKIVDDFGFPVSERDIINALELVRQLRNQHNAENHFIDPSDWDRFDAWQLLAVADGRTTIENIVWGNFNEDHPGDKVDGMVDGEATVELGEQ